MRRCMLRRMNRASVKWRVPHAQPACASTASDIISGVSFTVSTVSVLVLAAGPVGSYLRTRSSNRSPVARQLFVYMRPEMCIFL